MKDYLAKIEGHATLKINFKTNKVALKVDEGARFFEKLVVGRHFSQVPWIVSRICGVCPTVHYLTATKALEAALDVVPSPTTIALRKLMLAAQIMQSHLIHLFFFALPDYLGIGSGAGVAQRYPSQYRLLLALKRITDKTLKTIGGRPVHPISPEIGGFAAYPEREALFSLRDEIAGVLDEAADLISLFSSLDYPNLFSPTQYFALVGKDDYAFYGGFVSANGGELFTPTHYREKFTETVSSQSPVKLVRFGGESFQVGALARINLAANKLKPQTKDLVSELPIRFPSFNPFHNNLAQAIEIHHFLNESVALLNFLVDRPWGGNAPFEARAGRGVGAAEAPRGTLYHFYELDKEGKVADCDIITPTAQNLANLEKDARKFIEETKGKTTKEREQLLEMLIRAYDPCLTCSVH